MTTFEQYASYYDLLYGDKDYDGEAVFVADLIRRQVPHARSILEFGCGTGLHALAFARLGYNVFGIDLSDDMILHARRRLSNTPVPCDILISFDQGDVRTIRLPQRFDAVVSLFHVMSYQTRTEDVIAAMTRAAEHLHPRGVFIFDFWYGPAVELDPPTVRVKCRENTTTRVTRTAEPNIHPGENVVDVHYELVIEDHASGQMEQVSEDHRMRYFYEPEITHFLECAGLAPIAFGEWMTSRPPGIGSWSNYVVASPIDGFRVNALEMKK